MHNIDTDMFLVSGDSKAEAREGGSVARKRYDEDRYVVSYALV